MTDQLNNHEHSHYLQLKHPDLPEDKDWRALYLRDQMRADNNEFAKMLGHNDWEELLSSKDMYGKEESREFELERENERLKIVVDTLKEENNDLRKQLFAALPGLQSLQNNY